MEQGWIKFHRQTLENQFLMKDNNAYIVFSKLLLLVSQKSGEYTTGRFALAEHVNLKPNTLYSVLVRLESQKLINITSNNKYSVIRICNWKKYQTTGNTTGNNAATTRQQPDNNATTLNKNKELRMKNIEVAKATMSPKPATGGITLRTFFYKLVEELGYSEKVIATDKRLRKLRQRLNTFTSSQLIEAARVIRNDAHLQGDNDRGKRYGTIDFLLRSDEKVDELINSEAKKLTFKAEW
jgi:hypothetical protein